jgi:hypothetical protein
MFGALSAFGSHPRPDLLTRTNDPLHRLLSPVCLVGEAKTEETRNNDTVAQHATSAHSTLVLLVLAWCLRHPVGSGELIKFPFWAVLFGIAYTEKVVEVYAFYPRSGMRGAHVTWNFSSLRIHQFNKVMTGTETEKLQFMRSIGVIQRHARNFGRKMTNLLEAVFVIKGGKLEIKSDLIRTHPSSDRDKLRRISAALTKSVEQWDKLF